MQQLPKLVRKVARTVCPQGNHRPLSPNAAVVWKSDQGNLFDQRPFTCIHCLLSSNEQKKSRQTAHLTPFDEWRRLTCSSCEIGRFSGSVSLWRKWLSSTRWWQCKALKSQKSSKTSWETAHFSCTKLVLAYECIFVVARFKEILLEDRAGKSLFIQSQRTPDFS